MSKGKPEAKPFESKLPPVLKDAKWLTYNQTREELAKIQKQIVIIHGLPKVNGIAPNEYMHETLELIRKRCIALHWRMIELIQATYK